MESIAEAAVAARVEALPRFEDGTINMQELLRQLAEAIANEIMDVEADEMRGDGNSRNGYRERKLQTCVGTLTLRVPKLRHGRFFPEDLLMRHQRADRALMAAVAEMYATGTSTRKVQRIASKMGIDRISKDQVSRIARDLDADAEELLERGLGDSRMPYLWLDATYVKCRGGRARGVGRRRHRDRLRRARVEARAGSIGRGHGVLRLVDPLPEGHALRGRPRLRLVTSDAHEGLRRAIEEVFQGLPGRGASCTPCATA